MNLDEKDHDILHELKKNSRQSIRDIAKAIGLRPSTVHDRIQRMTKDGVIEKFTLKLNNKAVGENFIVFMLVAGKPTEYLREKLKFKDVSEFNDYVIKFRRLNKDIVKTLTMVVTVALKEEL